MERENKRMKKDLLKEEKNRIKKLVDLAKSKDPRIIKFEKEEQERIERQKEERRLEKQRKRDEEIRKKEEAMEAERQKRLKEEEEIRRKEEEIRAIKMAKKSRLDEIKQLLTDKVCLPEYGPTFVDFFFDGVLEEEQNSILETLRTDADQETMRDHFKDFVNAVKMRQNPQKKVAPPPPQEKKKVLLNKWTEEEIALLTKGVLKYPAGMGSRWEKITDMIGGSKTIHEVTAMAKELSIKNVRGEKNIMSTMEDLMKEKTASMESTPISNTNQSDDKTVGVSAAGEWSQAQQKALELAMKQFPATMDKKERWTKIAEAIPGKTAKQCIDRVKEIKDKLNKK